jgi:gamma-D-glutamyl-L-lysine dipeptidyl-peptidase
MVVPPYGIVLAPIADLRAAPSDDSELVDQVHYREMSRVLASRAGWHYVQAEDHYLGWVRGNAIDVMPGSHDGRLVGRTLAPVYREANTGSEVIGHLPAGTALASRQWPYIDGPWVWVNVRIPGEAEPGLRGYVSLDDSVEVAILPHRFPTADDLVATAEAFLGVPYLWGGTSGLGIDCSGYVQQVYRLNGLRLDRDAHQQALEGRPVDVPAPGDLIFFGGSSVTHVALATGERTFLNAPEAGRKVEYGELGQGRIVLAIRRYLP